MFTFT